MPFGYLKIFYISKYWLVLVQAVTSSWQSKSLKYLLLKGRQLHLFVLYSVAYVMSDTRGRGKGWSGKIWFSNETQTAGSFPEPWKIITESSQEKG